MLFDEIIFLVETILQEGYLQTVNRRKLGFMYENKIMCRAGYDLYLSIEAIKSNMKLSLTHYFPIDYEVFCADTTSFETPLEKWIYFTNQDFEYLSESVIVFVRKAQRHYHTLSCSDNVESFFSCKSGWVQEFSKKYKAGVVDDAKLEVRYLPFARPLDEMSKEGYDNRSFVQEPTIITLDCSTRQKRLEIELSAQKNIEKMAAIKNAFQEFLVKHCSIKEMLDEKQYRK